jgi:phage gpG-like protein
MTEQAFQLRIDYKQISQVANNLRSLGRDISSESILNAIALKVKDNIILRTQAGKDFSYVPFKAYNKRYAAEHKKTIVNLTLSGKMMNSITQKMINNNTIRLFFATKEEREKATFHNISGAGKNRKIREFFGVNENDEKLALKEYQAAIEKITKERKL